MDFSSERITDGEAFPDACAFCVQAPENSPPIDEGDNLNPDFQWSDMPEGTESLVLVCHDPDVPSEGDDVNQEATTVPSDLDRIDFYHWLLVDIDPDRGGIEAGEFSEGQTARGKDGPDGPAETRQGVNDYTSWFEGDPDMEGTYFGYDGPCPPWNDSIPHHYHFTLYALDVEEAPVEGEFGGDELLDAIEGHVLDEARLTGVFSLNPDVEV
jgi:Raf kinase inhibitor-like YbhB/YbcL family protein